MNIDTEKNSEVAADALVVLAYETEPKATLASQIAPQAAEYIQQLQSRGEVSYKTGKTAILHSVPGVSSPIVVVVGGGKPERFGSQEAYRCAAAASKLLSSKKRERVIFDFGPLNSAQARAAITGSMNGCYGQDILKAEPAMQPIERISWLGVSELDLQWSDTVGRAMLLTRELVNLPANLMYPESFTARAAQVAQQSGLELEVWDEMRLRKEGCGSLLAVAQGSSRPPRLLIIRHSGNRKSPPIALVGKGVTFDSGGLSLKPSDSMLTMKCDMAGAATVLGTMQAIAERRLDVPVVGLVGLVENMVSGNCFRLGDVLTARSGKTIEIHNTDAEGRLVLADVLNVALDSKPAARVDLATLTGACVVALGTDITGLMTNNEELQNNIQQAARKAGEDVWPLPMLDFFADQVKGKIADLKNMGDGRWGGAITAAKFLQEFVGDCPWVHMDIAGPAFYDSPKPFQDAGGTACMLRSLVTWLEGQ
ncbi:MAG: leucyl aminopeptidase [Pirellulales bacterium]